MAGCETFLMLYQHKALEENDWILKCQSTEEEEKVTNNAKVNAEVNDSIWSSNSHTVILHAARNCELEINIKGLVLLGESYGALCYGFHLYPKL